jgi:SH3-like domain-containing protein
VVKILNLTLESGEMFGHDIAQLLLTVMTDVGSCPNQFCLMFSTRLCVVNHDIAQWLLRVMTDVDSCRNQFCLMLSIRLCLVSHDIGQ